MPPDTGKSSSTNTGQNNDDPLPNLQIHLTSDEEEYSGEDDPSANGYELLVDPTGNLDDEEGEDDLRARNILLRQTLTAVPPDESLSQVLTASGRKESIQLSHGMSSQSFIHYVNHFNFTSFFPITPSQISLKQSSQ